MTIRGTYPSTEHFYIKDSIGVPHPHCIGTRHIVHAADHFSGRLGDDAIEDGERQRLFRCEVKGCQLSYKQHEQALLVGCKVDIKENEPELRTYLLSLKDEAEKHGYAGFAFLDERGKG